MKKLDSFEKLVENENKSKNNIVNRSIDRIILDKEQERVAEEGKRITGNKFNQLKTKPKQRSIGSYDEDMFQDQESSRKSNIQNITKVKADYNKILEEQRAKQEEMSQSGLKQNPNKLAKPINDFKTDKIVQKEVVTRKPIRNLVGGISVVEKTVDYGYSKNKKLNTLNIVNLTNIKATGTNLIGYIEGFECEISLLGFNSEFEMFLAIKCARVPISDGSGRLLRNGNEYVICFEVDYFNKNESVTVFINNEKFKFRFKELNKVINNNFTETIFGITDVKITRILEK